VRRPFRSIPAFLVGAALVAFFALQLAPAASADVAKKRPTRHRKVTHHRRPSRAKPAAPAPCANADTAASSAPRQVMKTATVCLINKERTKRGLPALRESDLLDRSAQGWTGHMVLADIFQHGLDFASRILDVGFIWSFAGENIATGFPTPRSVVRAWMGSKGHCHNILDPNFSRVGTGVVSQPVLGWASSASTWTQDFALPYTSSPPSGYMAPQNSCPY
jgi:uncharacterized protein YkwD